MAPEKKEKLIGKITHFFGKIDVGIIELNKASLKVGETIHIKGSTTDFEQKIDSIQVDHMDVEKAKKGDVVGIKVDEKVRDGDKVYLVLE